MNFPKEYEKNAYIKWHEAKFVKDKGFEKKLKEFRERLKKDALKDLKFISNIIKTVSSMASNEFRIQNGVVLEVEIPLSIISFDNEKSKKEYDLLFKSSDSIIEKLWRKNKEGNEVVQLNNVQEHISDLVRTEIITPTLEGCKFLAKRLQSKNIYFPDDEQEKDFKDKVKNVLFEPEMKMSSGYFAYHGQIHFHSGLIIEVQVYSHFMKSWRKLSHKLYEKARLRTKEKQLDYGITETRLISLGHLLHLAECELTRLENELKIAENS